MFRQLFPAVLMFSTLAWAQAQESQTTQNSAENKVFRVDVNIVQVDTVVTDKDGCPVTDLTAEDFIVLQDGKPQEITNFSLVRLPPPIAPSPAVQKKPSESREAIPAPPIQLTAGQVRRVVALVVDDLGLNFANIVRTRKAIRKWVDEEMQTGDLAAVITTGYGMGGLQQFTGDKRLLYDAIDRIRFNILSRANAGDSSQLEMEPIRRHTLGTLGAIRHIVNGMEFLPGRKSLILFSSNLMIHFDYLNPDPKDPTAIFSINPPSANDAYRSLIQHTNRAAVVIHTIDPRGGVSDAITLADREGLVALSQQTGGLAIHYHNFVELGLQEAARDGEFYYLIGYRPDAETIAEMQEGRSKYHNLKVRVKRPGMQVRSRSGFFSTTEKTPYAPAPWADTLAQAMLSPFKNDELMVHLSSGYIHDPDGKYLLRAWVHMPGRQLTVLRDGNGGNYISLETYAATTGFDGLVRDSDRMEHKIPLTNQDILSVREHGLRFSVTIPAKDPGTYFVRLAVKDQGSGKIGSAYQYVDIPDLNKAGVSLSNLFAVSRNEDIRWILSEADSKDAERFYSTGQNREKSPAIRQYQPGESLEYIALIYNADAREGLPPDLETQTVLYRDGEEIFRSESEAVDHSGTNDPARIPIKNRLRLGKMMPPGDYILQLQVIDKRGKKKKNFAAASLDFQVIPKQDPTNLERAETSILKGNEADRAGKKEDAVPAFEEAARLYREELENNPDDTVLWKQTGTVYFLAGKTNQAVAAYEEAVRLQPEDAEAHHMLGIIRASTDVDSSIGDFREAIRLNPENAGYHFDLGRALAQMKEYDAALESFLEAVRLDPGDGETHASIGIIHEQTGEVEKAVAGYRRALTLNLTAESNDRVRQLLQNALAKVEDPDTEKLREYYTKKIKGWRAAVERHTPGEQDAAAVEVGSWSVDDLRLILYLVDNIERGKLRSYIDDGVLKIFTGRRYVNENILPLLHLKDDPNSLLRRAALLHTDIARLRLGTGYAPEETLIFQDDIGITNKNSLFSSQSRSGLIVYSDGHVANVPIIHGGRAIKETNNYATSVNDGLGNVTGNKTAHSQGWHWRFARQILGNITPRPSEDPMVRKWYVATTAMMLSGRLFNRAEENLVPALNLFPSDPCLLFYKGVLHEKFALLSYQNAIPPDGLVYTFGPEESELKNARECFQNALKSNPEFSEARLHLGRIRGLLGDHKEAVEELQKAARSLTDTRLLYYCSLYLGNELAALNRTAEAREQFETAAKLYPKAQAPLLGLSQLALKSGDYENALDYGRKIFDLPVKEDTSEDPWWDYDISPVLDAAGLITEMYDTSGGFPPETSEP